MTRHFIIPEGRYYRGNLHGHSTESDGANDVVEVAQLYRDAGYDFTCISDHYWTSSRFCAQTVTRAPAQDSTDFVTITSAELHCRGKQYDRLGLWHILANGLPQDFPMASETESGPDLVRRAVEAGAFVTIAHPEWYHLTDAEACSLAQAGAHAVEIYNHSSAVESGRGGGTATVDLLHHLDYRVHIAATDDSHHIPGDAFGGWVMVRAENLTAADLVAALKAGDFYASCGPQFSCVTFEAGRVEINCSPVQRVILAGDNDRSTFVQGDELTHASFDLRNVELTFLRAIIIDANGKQAWTQAFWPEHAAE